MSETGIIGLQSTRFVDIGFLAARNRLRSTNHPILLLSGIAARSLNFPKMLEGFVPCRRILTAFVEEERYDTHVSRTYARHRCRLAVLDELDFPIRRIIVPDRNDEAILQPCNTGSTDTTANAAARPCVGVILRSRIGRIAIVYTKLIALGLVGGFGYPIVNDIALDLVDAVTVGAPSTFRLLDHQAPQAPP